MDMPPVTQRDGRPEASESSGEFPRPRAEIPGRCGESRRFRPAESRSAAARGLLSRASREGPAMQNDQPPTSPLSRTPILVVDDEPLIRWSVAETLRNAGYTVV